MNPIFKVVRPHRPLDYDEVVQEKHQTPEKKSTNTQRRQLRPRNGKGQVVKPKVVKTVEEDDDF